jgi:transcription initiation factor TFIIH subunit 3
LIVQISEDDPRSYNRVMNCIFSAQKLGVLVDSLVLSASHDSSFLQQASFLTNGVYLRPKDQSNALQSLLSHVLPSAASRKDHLASPLQRSVDFKASCSCHGLQAEFTYMCSVCLSLHCSPPDSRCDTCGTLVRKAAPE